MINVFIQNLPSQLSSNIKEQYENSLPIFKSYANSNNDKYYSEIKNNYELSCFILGLAIFYKSVIIPLREADSCFKDFKNQEDIRGIQIGKYTFSNNDRRQIQNMYNDMQQILQKYQLYEYILLFSDIKEFARNLNFYLKK